MRCKGRARCTDESSPWWHEQCPVKMSCFPRSPSLRYRKLRWRLRVNDEERKEKHGVKILLGGFSSLRAQALKGSLALLLTLKVDVSRCSHRNVGRASNDRQIQRFASLGIQKIANNYKLKIKIAKLSAISLISLFRILSMHRWGSRKLRIIIN